MLGGGVVLTNAEELIYEVICNIENDFDNKLTVQDIYQKLIKIQPDILGVPSEEELHDD